MKFDIAALIFICALSVRSQGTFQNLNGNSLARISPGDAGAGVSPHWPSVSASRSGLDEFTCR